VIGGLLVGNAVEYARVAASAAILMLTVVLPVRFGAADFPLTAAIQALIHRDGARDVAFVMWDLRLPRVLLALMIGAQLAASALVLQAALRNPLAEPGVIGVSSGATPGVMLLLLIANFAGSLDGSRLDAYDITWMPLVAQAGGIGAALGVYLLAWRNGTAPFRLILMGVAVSAAMYAVAMTILAGWGSSRIEVLPDVARGQPVRARLAARAAACAVDRGDDRTATGHPAGGAGAVTWR